MLKSSYWGVLYVENRLKLDSILNWERTAIKEGFGVGSVVLIPYKSYPFFRIFHDKGVIGFLCCKCSKIKNVLALNFKGRKKTIAYLECTKCHEDNTLFDEDIV